MPGSRHTLIPMAVLAVLTWAPAAATGQDDLVEFGRFLKQIEGVWPSAVVVDDEGRILVRDALRRDTRVFTSDGTEHKVTADDAAVLARQAETSARVDLPDDERHALPSRAVDAVRGPDGRLYAVDGANHRVVCLDKDGEEVWSVGGLGSFAEQFVEPTAVAIVPDTNTLLVTDSQNHRVQAFNLAGEYLYEWGKHALVPREGEGRIHYPNDIAVSPDGSFVVVAEMFERRLQLFGPMRGGATAGEQAELAIPDVQTHFGDVMTVDGRLAAVWEPEQRRVLVFDMGRTVPIHITTFGEYGTKLGQFTDIVGMALDEANTTLYILDAGTRRIDVVELNFDPEAPPKYDPLMAKFVRSMPVAEVVETLQPALTGLTLFRPGTIAVIDKRNGALHEIDVSTRASRSWHLPEPRDQAYRPVAATLDAPRNRMIVIDEWLRSVLVYGADRRLEEGLTQAGPGTEQLAMPVDLCVDEAGAMYVVDAGLDSIIKYDADSNYVKAWGGTGTAEGELWLPSAIGIDTRGRIVVLDYGNHRGQLFTKDGEWLASFSAGRAQTRRLTPPDSPDNAE